jgi:hypothetical protein
MFTLFFYKFSNIYFAAQGQPCHLPGKNDNQFFLLPHWWQYLDGQKDFLNRCTPHMNFPHDLWLIGLAVLNMLLWVAGFVAVLSIIIAGVELVASEGSPEKATNARNRLINSLVGLAIAVVATGFVSFVGNQFGGGGSGVPDIAANTNNIQKLLNIAFVIFGALAFMYVVVAGVRFIVNSDNPTKVSEARRQIVYAALGLVVISLSGAIVNYVLNRL